MVVIYLEDLLKKIIKHEYTFHWKMVQKAGIVSMPHVLEHGRNLLRNGDVKVHAPDTQLLSPKK